MLISVLPNDTNCESVTQIFQLPPPGDVEQKVIDEIDDVRKALDYALREPRRWTGVLRRVTLARAILGSNTIEGFTVDLDQALAAVDGEEELDAERETRSAIEGYRNAMTYVLQLAGDAHFNWSTDLIRSLHFMMTGYDLSRLPGRWRAGTVFVRNDQTGETVYESLDADQVPGLMRELVRALTEPGGHDIWRGALAHLNLVMVHPFKDGNGRMARCLQSLVLAREGILAPEFSSIEEYLGANTDGYYRVLREVGQGAWHPENDARPWLRFCLTAHYRQAQTLRRRVREIDRVWGDLERELASRHLPERAIFAAYEGAVGFRVTNPRYRTNAEVSEWVASRDLRLLVDAGFLEPHGERRGRFYLGSDWLRRLWASVREPRGPIPDPFGHTE